MCDYNLREEDRERALKFYRVFDSAPDHVLDDLAWLAATVCDTPIALIALGGAGRLRFVARHGLNADTVSHETSFCAHAMECSDLMVVPNAAEDPRFLNSPWVTEQPHIRFFAGVPLSMREGVSIGTLCVIDNKPRDLTASQRSALVTLRRAVCNQIELRRVLEELAAIETVLPMCAWCRSVFSQEGEWTPLHEYVQQEQRVTHSICPSCAAAVDESIGQR